MTRIHHRHILVNSTVLVPELWIAQLQKSVCIELIEGKEDKERLVNVVVVRIVSDNPFECLAACVAVHHMVQMGDITLTEYGIEQVSALWIQPPGLSLNSNS